MKLTRFSVQGFKNITRELVLDDLRDVNVIHGPNSVGKSNLMQAIGLFFACIQRRETAVVSAEDLRSLGLHAGDIISVTEQMPPLFRGELELSSPLLNEDWTTNIVCLEFSLSVQDDRCLVTATSVKIEKSQALIDRGIVDEHGSLAQDMRGHFWASMRDELSKVSRTSRELDGVYCRIDTERSLETQELYQKQKESASLALEMYDSQQSSDLLVVRRWRSFQNAMRKFQSVTGPGDFVITYQREEQKARLFFETSVARLPLRSLGSGVQQLVALVGRILMSRASIIAIEEPELNLRWNLQKQVSEVLQSLTRDPDSGIRQLFITSHSPAFESGEDFWLMEPGSDGPTISRHPRQDLARVLGPGVIEPGLPESAVPTWISSQGVLEVPPRVRKALGLEHGGSVMFEEKPHGVLMRSDQQVLDEMFSATATDAV